MLFKPFDLGKWFTLGFCAFLAQLGQGGSYNYRSGNAFRTAEGEPGNPFAEVGAWVSAHPGLTISLAAGFLVVVLGLMVLFMWLSSRGQFMLLDGVARNRAEVQEPWRRFRALANRLFRFRLALAGIGFGCLLILGACFAFAAIGLKHHGQLDSAVGIATLASLGVLCLLLLMAGAVVGLLLRDFVVPIMYLRETGPWESFGVLWREILPGNGWAFVRFYLMKLALGLASAAIIVVGCCLTCCLAALPYLSSVVFLPIHVFFRTYSLCFLEQAGEAWRVVGRAETA